MYYYVLKFWPFTFVTSSTRLLTAGAEGPASPVEIHHASPQVALPSGRGLVHADRDAGEGDVADLDPGHDPSAGLGTDQPLHHAVEALRGLPDGRDVVVEAQPRLQRGLKTEKRDWGESM